MTSDPIGLTSDLVAAPAEIFWHNITVPDEIRSGEIPVISNDCYRIRLVKLGSTVISTRDSKVVK